ncbi:MAG: prepilin peptidase [Dorea sp.]|jgi:Flp pilus assembly protein protease CpaA|nr:prepilin peptidase [Dorea sp.]
MTENIQWLREQWKNRSFRSLILTALILSACLTAEFIAFSYGILKIIRYLILFAALVVTSWIDWNQKRIPNKILLFLLAVRGCLLVLEGLCFSRYGLAVLLSALSGMVIGGGMFLLAHFISKGGVGMGDVKLFAVIGSYMGSGSITAALFLSVMSSAGYSVLMLILKKIKLKEEIPFAPFALVGTILTMALGM